MNKSVRIRYSNRGKDKMRHFKFATFSGKVGTLSKKSTYHKSTFVKNEVFFQKWSIFSKNAFSKKGLSIEKKLLPKNYFKKK